MRPGILQHLGVQETGDQQKRLKKARWGLAMAVVFRDVEMFGGPKSGGDKSLAAMGSTKKGRREIGDSKKDNSFSLFYKGKQRHRGGGSKEGSDGL